VSSAPNPAATAKASASPWRISKAKRRSARGANRPSTRKRASAAATPGTAISRCAWPGSNAPTAGTAAMHDVLARILARKRGEVGERRARQPVDELRARSADAPAPRGFARALQARIDAGEAAVIAEA